MRDRLFGDLKSKVVRVRSDENIILKGTDRKSNSICSPRKSIEFDDFFRCSFYGRHEKMSNCRSLKGPTNCRPILTNLNHFNQSFVLNALMPAAGCQDPSKP